MPRARLRFAPTESIPKPWRPISGPRFGALREETRRRRSLAPARTRILSNRGTDPEAYIAIFVPVTSPEAMIATRRLATLIPQRLRGCSVVRGGRFGRDFFGCNNGVGVDAHGIFDAARIASGQGGRDRNVAASGCEKDAFFAGLEA